MVKKSKKNIKELKKMILNDKEIKELAEDEIKKEKLYIKELKKKTKKHKKENVIIEIKAGTGGAESEIFMSDLKKMYEKFSKKMKWKEKLAKKNNIKEVKGIKIIIKGINVYKKLKYESGVHRVQRLPKTENKGRIHTSTCRVAVYKKKKKKLKILKNEDLKIETYKSSGAGGQHVNKTNSAIRIRHLPTNITIECQNERSQHKNKKQALKILKEKLINIQRRENKLIESKNKRKLLGEGKRAEKIRTYNYKKNIIIDHRLNLSFNLNKIMEGGELKNIIKKMNNKKKIS